MNNYFQTGISTIIIVGLIAILLVGAIIVAPIVNRPPSSPTPSTSPVPHGSGVDDQTISLLYLSTGDLELDNLRQQANFISCNDQPDSTTQCELTSPLVARPNLVIVKAGQLVFKRTITTPLANGRLPSFGNLSAGLGAASQVQKGSRFYGPQVQTYIFATKGITLIANPNTGEVQEVQVYQPTTTADYLSKFGEDIRGYTIATASAY